MIAATREMGRPGGSQGAHGMAMACPECGREMQYRRHGWHWDGSPAYCWQCVNTKCWHCVFDGEPPWPLTLARDNLFLAYIDQYGETPFETQGPPADFALQLRLFL